MDLRISLQKLEVLSQVVRRGGVGRAADALFVAQPVVTAHIRSLEERLGVKLFYRDGRQIHLTEAGQAVHEWAEDLLTRTRDLERQLGGLASGEQGAIALGASMSVGSYLLPHTLTRYQAEHPNAEVRVSIGDTERIIEDTRRGLIDFGLVVSAPDLDLPGLEVEKVADDEIVLVAAVDGEPEADAISIDELSELSFIEAAGTARRTSIDRQLRELGVVDRKVVLELGHPEATKAAIADGAGVSFLFRSATREAIEAGTLRAIAVDSLAMSMPIYLVHREGKSFSPLQRGLIEAAKHDLTAAAREALTTE